MTEDTTNQADTTPETETETEEVAPSYISYDDFAKLEIKIGTISEVAVVEDADKLLKLTVDFGSETRQIVSGIRMYFEDYNWLIGKQSPFITNLEPRVIRGLESQGMILAASHDETFAMLIPHNELPAGTQVY